MRETKKLGLVAAAGIIVMTAAAQAGTVVNDDFQSYANQSAFDAAWAPIGTVAPLSGVFTNTGGGAAGSSNWISVPTTGTNGQYRNRITFGETNNPSATNAIAFSFDYFDSNSATSPYRTFANLQDTTAPSGGGQLVSMGLNNNVTSSADGGNYYMARILSHDGGTGSGGYFKLNGMMPDGTTAIDPSNPAPLRATGWHNLKVVITPTQYKFYVDSVLSAVETNDVTLRSYDNITIGSALSSTANGGFDNVKLITDQLAITATGPSPADTSTGVGSAAGSLVNLLLDWDSQTNDKWKLYVWKAGDPVPTTPTADNLATSDFTLTGLDPSTLYNWRVDALNAFDDLAAGNVWSFTTTNAPEPGVLSLAGVAGAGSLLRRRRRI